MCERVDNLLPLFIFKICVNKYSNIKITGSVDYKVRTEDDCALQHKMQLLYTTTHKYVTLLIIIELFLTTNSHNPI